MSGQEIGGYEMAPCTNCFTVHRLSVNQIERKISFQHNGHDYCWRLNRQTMRVVRQKPLTVEVIVPDDVKHFGTFVPGQTVKLYQAIQQRVVDDGGW